jgi:NADH-quinone oxidoreductase subunit J
MTHIVFYVFASLALGGALGVVIGRNPVSSLLSMVVCLGSVAVIYVLLEAHFLAAVQIIVYAGAIMVLFLFVIMLLNLGHDDYRPDFRLGVWMLLAFAVSGGLFGFLSRPLLGGPAPSTAAGEAIDAMIAERGVIGVIAEPLYTDWVVPFEITGILLLVAIVGALVLAKRRV